MTARTRSALTLGVEEEYQLIDPATRALRQRAVEVVDRADPSTADVMLEMRLSQVEAATEPVATLADLRTAVTHTRRQMAAAAGAEGAVIAAAGTHPFSPWYDQQISPKNRYRSTVREYQHVAREHVVFGCHVHVGGLPGDAAIVATMDRARAWLPVLLALSANSPFWLGWDTGYASYRAQLRAREPMGEMPGLFGSADAYETTVQALVSTHTIRDESGIYWDIRPSRRNQTLEFRVADACLSVDETVMIAGLARALAATCYEQAIRDEPPPPIRPEVLRGARWRASRHGLAETLVEVTTCTVAPAAEVVEGLVDMVRPALAEAGDDVEIPALVEAALRAGTGAARQRAAYGRGGKVEDVVDLLVRETLP